jgi:large subunit ribosomal protein L25
MAEITLAAATGRTTGSRASGRLRAAGKVPATVYGLGEDPVVVAVDWRELRHALTGEAGLNALINLEVDGHQSELTIVKEMQRHPIKRNVLHVDFLRVSRDVAIEVDVPIVLTGEAEDVLRNEGVIEQVLFNLTISSKPGSIPNEIDVDVSELHIGDSVRIGDLKLPEGVEAVGDPEDPVVLAVSAQVSEADLETEADVEAKEAAAEAEAEGEGEGGGEGAGEGASDGGDGESSGQEG